MFPVYHEVPSLTDRTIRPDRRPPRANEIRLRVKRTLRRLEV